MNHRLSAEAIIEASHLIDPVFRDSRQFQTDDLSRVVGCNLILKDETDNPIGSFKGRGADYFVTKVAERGDDRLLVCASTGNFGQAMAHACRKHDRSLVVYADQHANPLKTGRITELGAEVRLEGNDFDAAKTAARRFCSEVGAWMIEDGHEPEISEGAGTISRELFDQTEDPIDAMLIPLGNGALINGNARWIKEVSPSTEVIGVCAEGADAMQKSWRSHSIVIRSEVDTISEGIAVRVPVPLAVSDMGGLVDDIVLVSDETTVNAMRSLHDTTGLGVEPSAVVGIAALMDDPSRFEGLRIATVLTGANLTDEQREEWLG